MLSLYINTSEMFKIELVLDDGVEKKERLVDSTKGKSQMVVPAIEDFLKEEGKQLSELTELTIHTGPGSFTGLRVGAAVARTLSLFLSIPLNGLAPGSLPELEYGEDKWKLGKK